MHAGKSAEARLVYECTGLHEAANCVVVFGARDRREVRRCRGVWRPRWVPYMSLGVPSRQHHARPPIGATRLRMQLVPHPVFAADTRPLYEGCGRHA